MLLPTIQDTHGKAKVLLEKFGIQEMQEKMKSLRDATSELDVLAGGAPDGGRWCDGLPEKAVKAEILEAFDASLKDINDDEAVSKRIAAVTQAKDDLFSSKSVYGAFALETHGEVAALAEAAQRSITQARTSEFENWVCRICLGGAKCKAKRPTKSVLAKHAAYLAAAPGVDPTTAVHPAVWAIARAMMEPVT
mmetsp:Transcript_121996/g.350526  ORF Transcript_121996/g.350526 Transcript_121996/m.350526 type:complete len:193 (-) Transcript_121996:121-699(-)